MHKDIEKANKVEPLPLRERIHLLTNEHLNWDWEGSPAYKLRTPGSDWSHSVRVDPFPCYAHNWELVYRTAKLVELEFPIGFKPHYFLLSHEALARTNGEATRNNIYGTGSIHPMPYVPVIVLSGKRTPLHPAMTRYLVAHEYGHCVDNWINFCLGKDFDCLDQDYASMRQIQHNQDYGGQKWHTNIGEIIDFRVTVCRTEIEFWPHDVPMNTPPVVDFWSDARAKYSETTQLEFPKKPDDE
jgi:hypothetical protein